MNYLGATARTVCAFVACCAAALLPLRADAQVKRYVVGQHLRAFERAWEQHGEKRESRKRVVRPLFDAFHQFFTARWESAAQSLDKARHLLKSPQQPPPVLLWADSIYAEPQLRLMDTSEKSFPVSLKHFYKVKVAMPKDGFVRIKLYGGKLQTLRKATIKPLPMALQLPLQNTLEGDHTLLVEIGAGKIVHQSSEQTVAFVANSKKRLIDLNKAVKELEANAKSTDTETVKELVRLLNALAAGRTFETNYPAARLLTEAEAIVKAIQQNRRFYEKEKTGQFWLRLKTKTGANVTRVFIPDKAKAGKPLPLVVALHGAGGSENLFFDALGRGKIVALCKKRGWLLAAPRGPVFGFRFPAGDIVDAMAEIYPVDRKRVFVVGHSMGAAQAMRSALSSPRQFAAVAALGGSVSLSNVKKIRNLPCLIGIGQRDFALEGARRMVSTLKKEGVRTVRFKEYADVEHIAVVQVALPDVFAFFDKANER